MESHILHTIELPQKFILNNLLNIRESDIKQNITNNIHSYDKLDSKLLLSTDSFRKWYDNIFQDIIKLISKHNLKNKNDENPCLFWEKRMLLVYFIYQKFMKKDSINFSFKENERTNPKYTTEYIRLQREYVHTLNNAILQFFPEYEEKKTMKLRKQVWNDGCQSDEYDEETDPRHHTWIMYYICLYPKEKGERSKKL